jgi:hypothetical protein
MLSQKPDQLSQAISGLIRVPNPRTEILTQSLQYPLRTGQKTSKTPNANEVVVTPTRADKKF